MPTSKEKPKQFNLTLSENEHELLERLAKDDNRSMADFLRNVIRTQYAAAEKKRKQEARDADRPRRRHHH